MAAELISTEVLETIHSKEMLLVSNRATLMWYEPLSKYCALQQATLQYFMEQAITENLKVAFGVAHRTWVQASIMYICK